MRAMLIAPLVMAAALTAKQQCIHTCRAKIERPRKSRESRFLDIPPTAKPCRDDTNVRGRFGVKRCGPSYRRARNASAALKNFGRHPKKYFSTLSAMSGHSITAHDANRVCCAARGTVRPRKTAQPNRSGRNALRFGPSFRFSMRLATMRLVTPAKVMPRCPCPKAWIRFG
jgi:hypothetical protein